MNKVSKETKKEQFFTEEELDITAKVSRLNLNIEERENLRSGLQEILVHFDTMDNVKLNENPNSESFSQKNDLRSDNVIVSDKRWGGASWQELMELAPDSEDNHFIVPNVL